MIFREKIILVPKKTVHIYIDYTNLSKGRSFIIITTHPIVFNTIIDSIIPRIAMFVNPIDKLLEIRKSIRLNTIYKFVETIYFLINTSKIATALVATTITFIEFLLQAQRDIILDFRYQYILLSLLAFFD